MGYDYVNEGGITVECRDAYDEAAVVEAIQHVLHNTRHVLEVHAVRFGEDPAKWMVSWKNLEHGVTY